MSELSVIEVERRGSWHVATIRGERHIPGYEPREMGAGMDQNEYRREILGDWSATMGKRVYPEFLEKTHVYQDGPLPFDPTRPLVCGLDQGGAPCAGTPAFVPMQLNAHGQLLIYPGLIPDEGEAIGIYEFGCWVRQYIHESFCLPFGRQERDLTLHWWGDPAGNTKPVATPTALSARVEARSCYEILRRGDRLVLGHDDRGDPIVQEHPGFGWVIRSGAPSLTERLESVRGRLNGNRHGLPLLVVDRDARNIIDGFNGAYHYRQRADGRYELDPFKNHVANLMDAIGYPCTRLFASRPARDEDDEPYVIPARGRAPGRPRVAA